MKIPLRYLIAAVLISSVVSSFSQQAQWNTDYAKAVAQAKTQNKPILLDFTGSDWCGWCMKMKQETLDTPVFMDYANKNLVLMEVDFPHHKMQSDIIKQQNMQLKLQYQASGFPTFILLDKNGKELGRQKGYRKGGPATFIEKLNTFLKPATSTTTGIIRQ